MQLDEQSYTARFTLAKKIGKHAQFKGYNEITKVERED
jgi:hypothetical protein